MHQIQLSPPDATISMKPDIDATNVYTYPMNYLNSRETTSKQKSIPSTKTFVNTNET